MPHTVLEPASVSRIIEMAWDDSTPFEAIRAQFSLDEAAVMALMRRELKASSYRLWRQRVRGRKTKHASLRDSQRALLTDPDHPADAADGV
jgi:uncharacterized protein (TIGR03643 family)